MRKFTAFILTTLLFFYSFELREKKRVSMPLQQTIEKLPQEKPLATSNFSQNYWAYTPLNRQVINIPLTCIADDNACVNKWLNYVFSKADFLAFSITSEVNIPCTKKVKNFWKLPRNIKLEICRNAPSKIFLELIKTNKFKILSKFSDSFLVKL